MYNFSKLSYFESRSICPENFTGEKGKGGMATEGLNAVCARELGQGWKISPCIQIEAGESFEIANIEGPGMIKHIWLTDTGRNRGLVIRIYWDGSDTPSVECPVGDFFACADYQDYAQVTSIPVCVNPKRAFNCYWDMPFYKDCKITIENVTDERIRVFYQIDYVIGEIEEGLGYFHAQFRRENPVKYGEVYTVLDNVEGRGHYVGTYMFWGLNNNGWWGEGEIKFYMDGDKEFPTICGTGTEDYFCGSWDFNTGDRYQEYSTPYAGVPKIIRPDGLYKSTHRFSMYRWHINDPIHFKKDLKVTIQDLGWRSGGRYLPRQDDISSVAFWYQDSICKTFPKFPSANDLEII